MTRVEIDHRSDSRPDGVKPASAPSRPLGSGRTAWVLPRMSERNSVSPADLLSMSHAAARMAAGGRAYSPDDRAEIAAETVAHALADMPGGPDAPAYPAAWVNVTRLYGYARNVRRTMDRDRARDQAEALANAAAGLDFIPADDPMDDPETKGTLHGAHAAARDMLGLLGLPRVGKCYPLAYAAARSAAGLDSREIAAELGMTFPAYRQALSRAAKRIPSRTVLPLSAHADALLMEDTARGVKAARSRATTTDIGDRANGWRGLDTRGPDPAPLRENTRRTRWGTLDMRPRTTPAQWTRGLPKRTRDRLAAAGGVGRARTMAKSRSDRTTVRLAHGITTPVP